MKWYIKYWASSSGRSSIEQWLNKLTKEQLKSVAKELKLLELAGNTIKMPHSKSLGKGLFELRERKYGYRIYYGFTDKQVIVLVAAGTKKSQERDIHNARERLSQLGRTYEN